MTAVLYGKVIGSELLCCVLGRETVTSIGSVQAASQADYLNQASESEWAAALEMATAQGIVSLLYVRLKALSAFMTVPLEIELPLRELYHINAMKTILRRHHLVDLLATLHEAEIPVIVLKGAFLAEHVYADGSHRSMSDVDLMVRQKDLERVTSTLRQLDYSLQNSEWGAKHLTFLAGNGRFPLEIHWHILNQADPFKVEVEDLWSRATPVEMSGQPVWVLSPEDLLLHLCLHASFSHGFRVGLRPFCDIDAVIAAYDGVINWDVVVARAADWRATRAVFLTLVLAQRLLKTAVPTQTLSGMQPPDWDEAIVEAALQNVFMQTDLPFVSTNFARMWREKRPLQKAKIMWRSATLPSHVDQKGEGKQYESGEGRNGRLRRYGGITWRLVRRDEAARREINLKNWLTLE